MSGTCSAKAPAAAFRTLSPPTPYRHYRAAHAVDARITVCRITGVQLVTGSHPFDGTGDDLVQEIQNVVPGDSEEMFDADLLQAAEKVT